MQLIFKKCVKYKQLKTLPVEVLSAALPKVCVREGLVFEVIGTDLCGLLFSKEERKC